MGGRVRRRERIQKGLDDKSLQRDLDGDLHLLRLSESLERGRIKRKGALQSLEIGNSRGER